MDEHILCDDRGFVESKLSINDAGQLHGMCEFFLHGKLTLRADYVEGRRHGQTLYVHAEGYVTGDFSYEQGHKHGEQKHYDAWGQLRKIETYHNGQLHGLYAIFHENGDVHEEHVYVESIKVES